MVRQLIWTRDRCYTIGRVGIFLAGLALIMAAFILQEQIQGRFFLFWKQDRLEKFSLYQGYAYQVSSDYLNSHQARQNFTILENGMTRSFSASTLEEVCDLGKGRFFQGQEGLYVSTSDNSDPRTNGREYVLSRPTKITKRFLALVIALGLVLLLGGLLGGSNLPGFSWLLSLSENVARRNYWFPEVTWIFFLALSARVAFYLVLGKSTYLLKATDMSILGVPVSDALGWDLLAENCAQGRGLTGAFGALRPFYSLTLAGLYSWVGPSYTWAIFLNVLAGSLTASLVFVIGRKAFNPLAGWVGGLYFALDPGLIEHSLVVMTEIWGLFLLFWSVWELLRGLEQKHKVPFFKSGLLFGLSNLTRTLTFVGLPFYLLALLFYEKKDRVRRLAWTLPFVLGLAIALVPWILRQKHQFGITGISANAAECLYAATSPQYQCWSGAVYQELDKHQVPPTIGARYDFFMSRARENLASNPGFYLNNAAHSFYRALLEPHHLLSSFLLWMAFMISQLPSFPPGMKPISWVKRAGVLATFTCGLFFFSHGECFLLGMGIAACWRQLDCRHSWMVGITLFSSLLGIALFGMPPYPRLVILYYGLMFLFMVQGVKNLDRLISRYFYKSAPVFFGHGGSGPTTSKSSDISWAPNWAPLKWAGVLLILITALKLGYVNFIQPLQEPSPALIGEDQKGAILDQFCRRIPYKFIETKVPEKGIEVFQTVLSRHTIYIRPGVRLAHPEPFFKERDDERTFLPDRRGWLGFSGKIPEILVGREVLIIRSKKNNPRSEVGSVLAVVPLQPQGHSHEPDWENMLVAQDLEEI